MQINETKNEYIIIGDVECNKCHGTGLYQGLAERDGAFVVCHSCNGKGCIEFKEIFHKLFTRKKQSKCKRVYSRGCSVVITDKDVTSRDNIFMPFSKYGCSYKDWLEGVKPIPLKFIDCPYLEDRSLQTKDKNSLYKIRCKDNVGFGSINECKLFHEKEKCWKIYEGKNVHKT